MRPASRPLHGQVIVITGASSGIGLLTARKAAAAGASVLLVARNEAALARAVAEITGQGGVADLAVADVGEPDQVEAAARRAVERFGRIDSWVNNAGVAIYAKLVETPIGEHERLFRTNYFGVVNGANAALPYLRETHGALITVASIASDLPSPLLGAYAASKHAVKGFINSLRIELREEKAPVSVTLIKPSGVNTPIGQHAANHRRGEARVPPPVYDPELVANAILDAARHPRRDVTIGGMGRMNVLFGTHFPAALDRLAPFMIPLLTDRTRRSTPDNSLFAPAQDGDVRSPIEKGRRFSLYSLAGPKPAVTVASAAVLAAGAFALWRAGAKGPEPAAGG